MRGAAGLQQLLPGVPVTFHCKMFVCLHFAQQIKYTYMCTVAVGAQSEDGLVAVQL